MTVQSPDASVSVESKMPRRRSGLARAFRWAGGLLITLILAAYAVLLIPYEEIPAGLKSAPFSVRSLAAALPGKPWWLMRLSFMARFGRADRDVGSGVYIEEWDVPEGTLRLTAARGPVFFEKASGRLMPMLKTVNPLEGCLLNTTCIVRFGKGYYGGSLILHPNLTYSHDGQCVVPRGGAKPRSFLLEHPSGRIEIHYAAGITPASLLEEIPDGTLVAVMEFVAADGGAKISVKVISDLREGGLRLIQSGDASGETAIFTALAWRKDTGMPPRSLLENLKPDTLPIICQEKHFPRCQPRARQDPPGMSKFCRKDRIPPTKSVITSAIPTPGASTPKTGPVI